MAVVLITGVCGSGKTTVGNLLAEKLHSIFADADQYHSAENIQKMSEGIPLIDSDRTPWLASMRLDITKWLTNKQDAVLACSALKKAYREQLIVDSQQVKLVYLKGSLELLKARLLARQHHYMKVDMLESQFLSLEEPSPDEALVVDIQKPIEKQIESIIKHFHLNTKNGVSSIQ